RLNSMGIYSIYDLAHTNYYELKSRMGIIGAQLYAHAWGIDRSFLGETVKPRSKSIGNSQVLDRDYTKRSEIKIVIREMGDQIATRLRHANAKAQVISLWIGFSMGYVDEEGKGSFNQQVKVPPTHSSKEIIAILLRIFENHYTNQHVRNIGVSTSNLIYTDALQLDLFSEPEEQVK